MDAGPWLPKGLHYDLHIEQVTPNGAPVDFTGGGWKLVWHTTEGNDLKTMDRVLRGKRAEPHLLLGRRASGGFAVFQYFPLTVGARALEHPTGTPATNSANCIQVEVCGFARDAHSWGDDVIHALAQLTRLIEHRVPVPRRAPKPFRDGADDRYTGAGFVKASGHVGHQHVASQPGGHWDPGALRIQQVFNAIKRLEA